LSEAVTYIALLKEEEEEEIDETMMFIALFLFDTILCGESSKKQ
jgi:hypothetical protein